MKNKNLRFRLLALLGGVFVLLLATTTTWAQTGAANVEQDASDPGIAALQYLSAMRVNPATGTLNPQNLLDAQKASTKLMAQSSKGDFNWETRGPINFSGRLSSFIFDANDATGKTMFVSSASGGIWKSVNGGLTYASIGDENNVFTAGNLYQADNGEIFVCTGDHEDALIFNGYGNFQGDGIYKIVDGTTLTQVAGTDPTTADSPWLCVLNFTIADGKYYAATIGGLFTSADNGTTWTLAKDVDGNELSAISTNVETTEAGIIMASVENHLYISTSGANGFVNYSTMYTDDDDVVINPTKLPRDGVSYLNFAASTATPSTLYAVLCDVDNPQTGTEDEYAILKGVYVSWDSGANWELVGPGGSDVFNIFTNNNGAYANTIAIDPTDDGHIFIGGTNIFEGNFVQQNSYFQWTQKTSSTSGFLFIPGNQHQILFHPTDNNIICTATDAGMYAFDYQENSISSLNKGLATVNCYSISADYNGSVMSATQSNNTIILKGTGTLPLNGSRISYPIYPTSVTGGRAYHSFIYPTATLYTNDGSSQIDYTREDAEAPQDIHLDGITDNDETFLVPSIFWESFSNVNSRDSIEFKATEFMEEGTKVVIQSNSGYYPMDYTLPHDLPLGQDSTIMIQDVVSSRFFIALNDNVYMTREILDFTIEADSIEWDLIASKEDSGFEGLSSAVAVSNDANHLFVGTQDGNLYRISNLALAYDSIHADVRSEGSIVSLSLIQSYPDRVITGIAVDPNDLNRVLVTLGNYGFDDYIYVTENAIDEVPVFTSIQGNLPKMPVYTGIFEMNVNDLVIIGTDMGIYECEDIDNTSWVYSSQGIGTVPIFEIKQQTINHYPIVYNGVNKYVSNFGAIYAATGGRGVFESRRYVGFGDNYNQNTATVESFNIYPNPVVSSANIDFTLAQTGYAMINVFDINGRILKTENLNILSQGNHTVSLNLSELQQGTYIMQLVINGKSTTSKFMIVK